MVSIYERVNTILIGRNTYDLFVDFWPDYVNEDDPTGDFMNFTTKIVFSKTLKKASWGKYKDAVLLHDNLEDNVKKLKLQPGKDTVVFGSGSLVSALSQADLVDEYRFIINSVILGSGRQMVENVNFKHPLKLKAATVLYFGTVILDYERGT